MGTRRDCLEDFYSHQSSIRGAFRTNVTRVRMYTLLHNAFVYPRQHSQRERVRYVIRTHLRNFSIWSDIRSIHPYTTLLPQCPIHVKPSLCFLLAHMCRVICTLIRPFLVFPHDALCLNPNLSSLLPHDRSPRASRFVLSSCEWQGAKSTLFPPSAETRPICMLAAAYCSFPPANPACTNAARRNGFVHSSTRLFLASLPLVDYGCIDLINKSGFLASRFKYDNNSIDQFTAAF